MGFYFKPFTTGAIYSGIRETDKETDRRTVIQELSLERRGKEKR